MDERPPPKALKGVTEVRERDIERKCVNWWRHQGHLVRKLSGANYRHWPDRLFINPDGLHLYVEFKSPGKLLTPGQARMVNQLRNSGCHVYIVDDGNQGLVLLQLFKHSEQYIAAIKAGVDFFNVERDINSPVEH